ncbi:YjdF family protein [Clostridium kluyveri]|uniref:YjdF family protein n=1 Tax=Clostridium kluyveri TaxID=1534 RepID=UPI0022470E98|nr:YjdF family protein [Clostridium kluyveri]UZQ49007.1 YjdF family protein [Clostridium kluyveri]
MEVSIKFTVFFEDIFWVGIFEKVSFNKYEVSKVVFGSEPKDYEVYDFILKHFCDLKFGNSLLIDEPRDKKINPKRLQREIKKQTQTNGIGTKAQLAMKLQYEQNKSEKRKNLKEKSHKEKEWKFRLYQRKKKEKHKGH